MHSVLKKSRVSSQSNSPLCRSRRSWASSMECVSWFWTGRRHCLVRGPSSWCVPIPRNERECKWSIWWLFQQIPKWITKTWKNSTFQSISHENSRKSHPIMQWSASLLANYTILRNITKFYFSRALSASCWLKFSRRKQFWRNFRWNSAQIVERILTFLSSAIVCSD